MIFDQQRVFLDKKNLTNGEITSDILDMGVGEASMPLTLVVLVSKDAGTGTLKIVLETSVMDNFAAPKTIGTYDQVPLSVHLPRGNRGYLRLKVTSTYTKGTVTAGLVLDDNIDR